MLTINVHDLQSNIVGNVFRCNKVKKLICSNCIFLAKYPFSETGKCGCYENDFDLAKIRKHDFEYFLVSIDDLMEFKTIVNVNKYIFNNETI